MTDAPTPLRDVFKIVHEYQSLRAALIAHASPAELVLQTDDKGDILLMHAVRSGSVASALELLRYGAEEQLAHVNRAGVSVLQMAAFLDNVAMVRALLDHATDQQLAARFHGGKGSTLLGRVVRDACNRTRVAKANAEVAGCGVVRTMLGQSAVIARQVAVANPQGLTPVGVAAKGGHAAMLELLLPHVPPGPDGVAVLDGALKCLNGGAGPRLTDGQARCARILFARGANIIGRRSVGRGVQDALRETVSTALVPDAARRATLADAVTQLVRFAAAAAPDVAAPQKRARIHTAPDNVAGLRRSTRARRSPADQS